MSQASATDPRQREARFRAEDTSMNPVARAIPPGPPRSPTAGLPYDGGEVRSIDSCVIAYGDLCRRAGVPAVVRRVGHFSHEVAEWCDRSGSPPLNSLGDSQDSRLPGDNYDVAPSCSLLDWPAQAQACIAFTGFPEHAG